MGWTILQFAVREVFAKDFAKPMPSSAFGERLDRQAFLGPWMGTFLKWSTAPKKTWKTGKAIGEYL